MTKTVRVSIHEDLHGWLDEMAQNCQIGDYSRLVCYLLQRLKDTPVFGYPLQLPVYQTPQIQPSQAVPVQTPTMSQDDIGIDVNFDF